MEDIAEKTHKGLPAELEPDNTGVRKSFVYNSSNELFCRLAVETVYSNLIIYTSFLI